MTRTISVVTMCLVWLAPAVVLGQGSAPTGPAFDPSVAFTVTRDVTGSVVALDTEGQKVLLQDDKGKQFAFVLAKTTRYSAEKRTAVEGRTNLGVADLALGQRVRLTFHGETGAVLALRWLRPKS